MQELVKMGQGNIAKRINLHLLRMYRFVWLVGKEMPKLELAGLLIILLDSGFFLYRYTVGPFVSINLHASLIILIIGLVVFLVGRFMR
jgi:hypothetical protein